MKKKLKELEGKEDIVQGNIQGDLLKFGYFGDLDKNINFFIHIQFSFNLIFVKQMN